MGGFYVCYKQKSSCFGVKFIAYPNVWEAVWTLNWIKYLKVINVKLNDIYFQIIGFHPLIYFTTLFIYWCLSGRYIHRWSLNRYILQLALTLPVSFLICWVLLKIFLILVSMIYQVFQSQSLIVFNNFNRWRIWTCIRHN